MYKVCIFDLDGTLADTLVSIAYNANRALEAFGLPTHPVQKYRYFAGDGADELIRRCLKESGDEKLEYYTPVREIYREFFREDCLYEVKPFDGMVEALKGLKEQGVKIAVLSNKPHENSIKVVETLFGKGFFDYIQGQQVNIPRKPSPAGALHIAKMFGAQPCECLYFGDTNTDMKTGKSAGMKTVGVTWGFREKKELEENGADLLIDHPSEIADLIKRKCDIGGNHDSADCE
ncbi:MAG: HAD family hydrolase [Lachnospiraceae bacterium]|nr:HAD family hydrolase [Robinsoniella sp.]MDY3766529.1 HAD family hydrolase [Lachnospiraceae bacterium]